MATSEIPTKTAATAATTTASTSTQESPQSKWANLPSDIMVNLLRYIDLNTDVHRLRSVCPSWRSALKLSDIPEVPSTIPTPNLTDSHRSCLLVQSHFYLFTPLPTSTNTTATPWLARMAKIGHNKWHIFNPLNHLDYFMSFPPLSGKLNLLDCTAERIATSGCLLENADRRDAKPLSKKVVGGWNFRSKYLFAVLIQLETPGRGPEGGLMFWRLLDEGWTKYEQTFLHNYRILDIACFNGLFYAFDLAGWRIGVIDPEKDDDKLDEMEFFSAPNILGDHIDDCFSLVVDDIKYLLQNVHFVVSKECLTMVIFCNTLEKPKPKKTVMFVYVLKEREEIGLNSWVRMPDLGDEIFLIGYDASFSIPASASKSVPLWKPNSVCLFTWPFPMLFDYGEPKGIESVNFASFWRYYSMYDPNKEREGFVRFEELGKDDYTRLFFPPPAFVKWYCPSNGNVEVILHDLKFDVDWLDGEKSNDGHSDDGDDTEDEEEDVGGDGGGDGYAGGEI